MLVYICNISTVQEATAGGLVIGDQLQLHSKSEVILDYTTTVSQKHKENKSTEKADYLPSPVLLNSFGHV